MAVAALIPEVRFGWEVVIIPAGLALVCLAGGILLLRSPENRRRVWVWIVATLLLLVALGVGTCCVAVVLG